MKLSTTTNGVLLTAISALGFSTLPIFGVIAYQAGSNVTTLLAYRFLIGTVALWSFVLVTRRPLPGRSLTWKYLLLGAVGYTLMSALYMSSVAGNRLSPALAALLLYTYPAIVTLLAWAFDGLRLSPARLASIGMTLLGVVLVLVAPGMGALFTTTGALLALSAAVVYSLYIFLGSRVSRQSQPPVVTAYVTSATATVFLVYGLFTHSLVGMAPAGWWAVLGTGFFATVVGMLLFFAGMDRLGPAGASIVSALEPVGTVLLSAVLFGDRLGWGQVAGGLLVLAGIVWLQAGAKNRA